MCEQEKQTYEVVASYPCKKAWFFLLLLQIKQLKIILCIVYHLYHYIVHFFCTNLFCKPLFHVIAIKTQSSRFQCFVMVSLLNLRMYTCSIHVVDVDVGGRDLWWSSNVKWLMHFNMMTDGCSTIPLARWRQIQMSRQILWLKKLYSHSGEALFKLASYLLFGILKKNVIGSCRNYLQLLSFFKSIVWK